MPPKADLGPLAPQWDRVPRNPQMTDFKRAARLQQAAWRAKAGYAYGEQPLGQANGSTLAPGPAAANANFLSDKIVAAVEHRQAADQTQKYQTLDVKRLRANLLSSMPMCFNLFGELHKDASRITATGRLIGVRDPGLGVEFEWSPGRLDRHFTADRTAFDAALFFGAGGPMTVIGIETKYHEHAVSEKMPDGVTRLPRYREITETSNLFAAGWEDHVLGTPLQQIWRDHLLLLSMLQHPSGRWAAGKYVLVHPRGNVDFANAARRYRTLLADESTFVSTSIEDLLDLHVLQDEPTEQKFRERYLPR